MVKALNSIKMMKDMTKEFFENNKLIKSEKVNLKKLLKSKKDSKAKDNHDKCLKAADYKGCMNYQKQVDEIFSNYVILFYLIL